MTGEDAWASGQEMPVRDPDPRRWSSDLATLLRVHDALCATLGALLHAYTSDMRG